MVFKRQSDKQSYENQNHKMQTEPYMVMPQVGRPSMNQQPQGQSSSHSRAMTGPLHDPRKDIPAQQHYAQNSMYHNQYAGQGPIYPQHTSYLDAYGTQQQSAAMHPQYLRSRPQNNHDTGYAPQHAPLNPPEDLKGLSFWQEDTEHNYHDEAEDDNESSSPIKFVLTILALVAVSVILWLGYRFATQPQNTHIPLIQADSGIYKLRPEHPGGEYFPHQDMHVYNRLTPHQQIMVQQERILPQDYAYPTQEEMQQQEYYQQQGYDQQPQNYPAQAQEQAYSQEPYYQNQPTEQPAPYAQQPTPYAQQPVESQNAPQQTSEQPVVQQQEPVAPIVAPVQETIPSVADVKKNMEEQTISANDKKMGVVDPDSVFVEPEKKPVQSEPAQSKPLAAGYYMQLGSMLPSHKSAETEWNRIRRKFTTELGDYKPIFRPLNAGVKKKYRLLIGPFSSKNNPLKKCMRIGNGCRVVQVG